MGFWILLLAFPIFGLTFLALTRVSRWKLKLLASSLPLMLTGILALLVNFGWHGHVAAWVAFYMFAGFFSCWVRYIPFRAGYLTKETIYVQARLETLKQRADEWRIIATSLTFGYMAIIAAWLTLLWGFSDSSIAMPQNANAQVAIAVAKERMWYEVSVGVQTACLSLYVVFALLRAAYSKAHWVAAHFTQVRPPTPV
jgi:hypothetical protein